MKWVRYNSSNINWRNINIFDVHEDLFQAYKRRGGGEAWKQIKRYPCKDLAYVRDVLTLIGAHWNNLKYIVAGQLILKITKILHNRWAFPLRLIFSVCYLIVPNTIPIQGSLGLNNLTITCRPI